MLQIRRLMIASAATCMLAGAGGSASAAVLEPLLAADPDYGIFLGTWGGNACNTGGPEARGNCWEDLLSAAYPTTPPISDLGTDVPGPGNELINQLNTAGKSDPVGSQLWRLSASAVIDEDGDSGSWTYHLFDDRVCDETNSGDDEDDCDSFVVPPGDADKTVDAYLVLKYSTFASVFYYPDASPTALLDAPSGLWSLNPDDYPVAWGVGLCAKDAVDEVNGAKCIGTAGKSGKPAGISHIELFWPDEANGITVPEPATLALFGAGLIGLGWLRRRRKA